MVVVMASRRASMNYERLHPGGGHTEHRFTLLYKVATVLNVDSRG